MRDLTVIYYTCNKEKPEFEAKIRRTLWHTIKSMRIPLISVSHKPIDFGENICVGDVGISGHNAFRQLQIGAMAAKTKFVCPAEADFLYPREYFEFRPDTEDHFYVALPIYVLFAQKGKARAFRMKPKGSEAAMIVGREFLIDRIEQTLKDLGKWGPITNHANIFKRCPIQYYTMSIPSVTFKTDNNMHRRTVVKYDERWTELPHWGTVTYLLRKYLG